MAAALRQRIDSAHAEAAAMRSAGFSFASSPRASKNANAMTRSAKHADDALSEVEVLLHQVRRRIF